MSTEAERAAAFLVPRRSPSVREENRYARNVPGAFRVDDAQSADERDRRHAWLDVGVLAGIPLLLAGLRVLFYSGGDPTLLRVLLSTLDVTTVLLGTFLPLLPVLIGAFLLFLLSDPGLARQFLSTGSPLRRRVSVGVLCACALFYVLLAPWTNVVSLFLPPLLVVAIGSAVHFIIVLVQVRESPALNWRGALRSVTTWRPPIGTMGRGILVVAISATLVFVLPVGMWLPQENIRSTTEMFSGYVLDWDEDWTTVLEGDKRVTLLPSEEVLSRAVCDQGGHESLINVTFRAGPGVGEGCIEK